MYLQAIISSNSILRDFFVGRSESGNCKDFYYVIFVTGAQLDGCIIT